MKAIGIILAGGNNKGRLGALTDHRAAAALPIGGCYRAIDFTLSNMTNSGIGKAAILTQYNSRSLRDHLTSSKWWNFGRKQGGLFVFTPFTSSEDSNWFRGTADSIYQNMSYLMRSSEEYVVITSGDAIYKMDYRQVIAQHVEKGADITIVYQRMEEKDLSKFGVLEMDEDGRLTAFMEKPTTPDLIVLDPPRDGVHPKALRQIVEYGVERMVYISCKPTSLARDLEMLIAGGYRVERVRGVDMFPGTVHVETVCLLSQRKPDAQIEVNLEMSELELSSAETKATYEEIKSFVLEKHGLKVTNLYIAQVKRECGVVERENYNLPKNEDGRVPQCPEDKRQAIKAAFRHFKMI